MEQVVELVEQLLREHPPASTSPEEFWAAQFDLGLAWIHFPVGRGGLGLDPRLQEVVDERLREAGAPSNLLVNMMGVGMAGPTLLAYGTDEHLDRFLRPAFSCDEIWCQMFSEPGAGSDLAALSTRAERDGDEWVINGQKVWTTLAHVARWGLLLTRTDPEAPKHRGLTYFFVDMHAPGIEVRPLRQLTGDAEFNEIYFTDYRVPDSQRLGEVGDGWRVALTTLMNERVTVGALGKEARGQGEIRHAVDLWHKLGGSPVQRDRLTRLWIEGEVLRLTNVRAQAARDQGDPGPEGSILKLMVGGYQQRLFNFIVDLLGPDGQLVHDYVMRRPTRISEGSLSADGDPDLQKAFLESQGTTIGGGTTQIGKNILGERVLGLPAEPRVDKDVPWSQVPRS
ncbi:MAG: acyl-CoA dehydrogenase family protein [Actinomycetota bacterium]|nr:acyl-CoA dehydrogenase family protein [Actinomycetota bacterium]